VIKLLTAKQISACFKELEQMSKVQCVLILIISIGVDANIRDATIPFFTIRSDPENSEAAVPLSPTHDARQTGSHSFPMESSAI